MQKDELTIHQQRGIGGLWTDPKIRSKSKEDLKILTAGLFLLKNAFLIHFTIV